MRTTQANQSQSQPVKYYLNLYILDFGSGYEYKSFGNKNLDTLLILILTIHKMYWCSLCVEKNVCEINQKWIDMMENRRLYLLDLN